jgi:hypothetical protein
MESLERTNACNLRQGINQNFSEYTSVYLIFY